MSPRPILLTRLAFSAVATLAVATMLPRSVAAQTEAPVAIEGYYGRFHLDAAAAPAPGERSTTALGGRLLWYPGADDPEAHPFLSRTSVGLFGEYAPEQDRGFNLVHAGLHGDLRLLRMPLFGRLQPTISLGAGVFTTRRTSFESVASGSPFDDRTRSAFALTPGAGLQLRLWRAVNVRADVRDVITMRDGTRNNLSVGGGLSLRY
jgi:hypothetical protein